LVDAFDQIEFDFSLEELVALQMDFVRTTSEGKSWRKREQRRFVVTAVVVATVVAVLSIKSRDLVVVASCVAAAVVIAVALAVPFGSYYDRVMRTRTARLLAERMGPGPYHCSIEIHPDALRVAQAGIGFVFPWSSAVRVDDTFDGVVVDFTTGRVLARTRGFTSEEHRQHFLRRVREFVSEQTAVR
jgi:hypothetical protein